MFSILLQQKISTRTCSTYSSLSFSGRTAARGLNTMFKGTTDRRSVVGKTKTGSASQHHETQPLLLRMK